MKGIKRASFSEMGMPKHTIRQPDSIILFILIISWMNWCLVLNFWMQIDISKRTFKFSSMIYLTNWLCNSLFRPWRRIYQIFWKFWTSTFKLLFSVDFCFVLSKWATTEPSVHNMISGRSRGGSLVVLYF